jgi:Bacterial protein of unknown function (DUF916)
VAVRLTRTGVLLLALLLLMAAVPTASWGADNGRWSVFPAPSASAGTGPTAQQRQFFALQGDPGTVLRDKVSVSNLTDRPMTFRLYGADAYNTARDGGFAVRTIDEKSTQTGAWIRLVKTRITVPPRQRVDVPFQIRIPADAAPGDHPGAVVALDTRTEQGAGDLAVAVRRAVGARVYLRVGGPALPALAVSRMTVRHHQPLVPGTGASTAVVHYRLVNRGNVTLRPRVRLTARGLFGRTLLSRPAHDTRVQLLPGQSLDLTETWTDAPHLDHVRLALTATAQGGVDDTAGVSYTAVPWAAVGALLAAAAAVAAWTWTARRRRATAPAPATPEPAAA